MKIVSANVNGRVKSAARRQLDAVLEQDADVVALQEVTTGNYSDWCQGLTQAGYSVLSTVDLLALPYSSSGCRSGPSVHKWAGRRRRLRTCSPCKGTST